MKYQKNSNRATVIFFLILIIFGVIIVEILYLYFTDQSVHIVVATPPFRVMCWWVTNYLLF